MEILLVEDNEDDIVLLKEAFAEVPGLHLLPVQSDGDMALSYLRRSAAGKDGAMPDLVMLDINLPKKNGFEVIAELKADADLRHLPVVMLTVSEREEDIRRCYALGACSYVRKPEDFNKLTALFRQFEIYWTTVSRLPLRRH
jgi:CheY-like chemotaxis protein